EGAVVRGAAPAVGSDVPRHALRRELLLEHIAFGKRDDLDLDPDRCEVSDENLRLFEAAGGVSRVQHRRSTPAAGKLSRSGEIRPLEWIDVRISEARHPGRQV